MHVTRGFIYNPGSTNGIWLPFICCTQIFNC